jgi:hypothetical protein
MSAMLAALRLRVEVPSDGPMRVSREPAKSVSGIVSRAAPAPTVFDAPRN